MDTNIAAWMIAGGPRIELRATQREREQLHAYLDSQRAETASLVDRIRRLVQLRRADSDLGCCPA